MPIGTRGFQRAGQLGRESCTRAWPAGDPHGPACRLPCRLRLRGHKRAGCCQGCPCQGGRGHWRTPSHMLYRYHQANGDVSTDFLGHADDQAFLRTILMHCMSDRVHGALLKDLSFVYRVSHVTYQGLVVAAGLRVHLHAWQGGSCPGVCGPAEHQVLGLLLHQRFARRALPGAGDLGLLAGAFGHC